MKEYILDIMCPTILAARLRSWPTRGRKRGVRITISERTAFGYDAAAGDATGRPDRSRSIFGGKGSGPMDRRRRRGKAAASVRRGRTEEERTGSRREEEEVAPVSPVEMLFERHQQSERANERAELTD